MKRKIKLATNKKGHRQPLASTISGFTIRTNKKNAAKEIRGRRKVERQKSAKISKAIAAL